MGVPLHGAAQGVLARLGRRSGDTADVRSAACPMIHKRRPSMTSQIGQDALPEPVPGYSPPVSPRLPRVLPASLLLGIFWALYSALRWTEVGVSLGFTGFVALFGAGALTVLLFAIWWLAASRVRWAE